MGDGATHQKADRAREIVVEALTRNVKEDHVREIFGKYGVIKELTMPMNPTSYILYEEIDDAERTIAKMHDAQLDGAKIQVSIVLPRRRFSQTPPPARRGPPPRDDYEGGYGRGHHLWMAVIDLRRVECRPIEDTGVGAEAEAVAVDEGPTEDGHGRTHVLAAGHHDEAYRALLTVARRPEHHQDEVGEEAMAGETVHQGGEVARVQAAEGGVQAIAPMAATGVEAETADERRKIVFIVGWKSLEASAQSSRSSVGLFGWPDQWYTLIEIGRRLSWAKSILP
ncbi:uncharacterized protein J4E78_002130 [Alternaria triticimaculans]|uniref:uncharacterized protein n=1 Tax=Alternaria triticimaculans TaxID=297637 RepID=UPI0020C42424|nr:uncharacterized protein J4E78_002130 [Alternaria triticimaculans]KAI4668306.1 hypothetical protein J4E78_002130 [Alternaria triticimaculans]